MAFHPYDDDDDDDDDDDGCCNDDDNDDDGLFLNFCLFCHVRFYDQGLCFFAKVASISKLTCE